MGPTRVADGLQKLSRRTVLTRQWRRERRRAYHGAPQGATQFGRPKREERAKASRSHSSGRRHRGSHAAACDDDGPKRRSAPSGHGKIARA